MKSQNRQSKKPILLFVAMIAFIVVVMTVAHLRNPDIQLVPPAGRVTKLFTVDNSLVAISDQQNVHIWSWSDLSAKPEKTYVEAECVTFIGSEELLTASPDGDVLIVSKVTSGKQLERIPFPQGWKCESLRTTRNGRFTAVGLKSPSAGNYGRLALAIFDSQTSKLTTLATFDPKSEDFLFGDAIICEEGDIAVIAGSNNGGWLAAINVLAKRIIWEKTFDESGYLDKIEFSPSAKALYAAGEGASVLVVSTSDGELKTKWTIGNSQQEEMGLQSISVTAIEASPDGRRFIATGAGTRIYMWDPNTGESVRDWAHNQRFSLSGMAFSPDSSHLATSSIQPVVPIRIWPESLAR
jgi:WD40 repeat protein